MKKHSREPPTGKVSAVLWSKVTRKHFVNFKEIHQTGPKKRERANVLQIQRFLLN